MLAILQRYDANARVGDGMDLNYTVTPTFLLSLCPFRGSLWDNDDNEIREGKQDTHALQSNRNVSMLS